MNRRNLIIIIVSILIIVVILIGIFVYRRYFAEKPYREITLTEEELLQLPGYYRDEGTGEVKFQADQPKQVLLRTDRTSYSPGQEINVSVTNNLDGNIELIGGQGCCSQLILIEKINDGSTEKIQNYAGDCVDIAKETVNFNQTKEFVFTPVSYDQDCRASNLEPGRYRFYVRTDYPGTFKVYSNLITIE